MRRSKQHVNLSVWFGPPFERYRASLICFATCVCLSARDSGRLVVFCFATCVCMSAFEWSQLRSEKPKSALLSIEIDSRRLPNRPSEASKSTPDRPGELQERPRDAKSLPRAPQKCPRASQERPKSAQERPRAAQERPRAPQERPRATQELLLIVICSATRSRSAFVTIFDRVSHRARKRGHTRNVCFPYVFPWFSYVFR